MAESSLSLTTVEFRKAIARYLGLGVNVTFSGLTATEQADVNSMLNMALRQFYWPHTLGTKYGHRWSFLMPTTTITTSAPYETGTVTIVAGVVTLDSGTFPSWAADGELILDGITYTVNTRDGNTQVTLDDLTVAASAGSEYQLVRPFYTMPDDFGGLLSALTWRPGETSWTTLEQSHELALRERRQYTDLVDAPQRFALRPKTFDATVGQRFELLFEPVPDDAYIFTYTYRVRPNQLSDSNLYPYGGAEHSETILASCLAVAEKVRMDAPGPMMQEFLTKLQASIAFDQEVTTPHFLGIDTDRSEETPWPSDTPRLGGGYIVPDGYTLGN